MTRPPVLLAASTALAALALAGCSGSASSSSGTVGGDRLGDGAHVPGRQRVGLQPRHSCVLGGRQAAGR